MKESTAMKPLNSILYIEDDVDALVVGQMTLCLLGGFAVRAYSSGREALVASASWQPDLILLDMTMPDMDGISTLTQLRRMHHMVNVPAIFVTSLVSSKDLLRYRAAGAIGAIAKPLDPARIVEQIHRLWSEDGLNLRHNGNVA